MTPITYVVGDATNPPVTEDVSYIAHICNNAGQWGAGFVMALSARDNKPELAYRKWFRTGQSVGTPFKLGEIQYVFRFAGREDLRVVNMVAQDNLRGEYSGPLVSYLYLWRCLLDLRDSVIHRCDSVHMPRIGCGIGGGEWPLVAALIEGTLSKANIPVFVYDFNEQARRDATHKWGRSAVGW